MGEGRWKGPDMAKRLGSTNYYLENKYATRIYCITQGIWPIFYNSYKWNITFKIVNY